MKLSSQAIGALLMTLQKCLSEQIDITDLLSEWELSIKNDEVFVDNPPPVYAENSETNIFETE
mgnify:CR=1 FL=1|tara:strand:+ start:236 stop:424 length:189 start_codon:yes stop_codon:yes gene_type:complete